jgi:hypothetical protein
MSEKDPEKIEHDNSIPKLRNDTEADAPLISNKLLITLEKESFFEDETVKGNVLITITETFYPKKLALSVVGELASLASGGLQRQKTLSKKPLTTQGSSEEKDFFRKQSIVKNPSQFTRTPTLTRTFTLLNKKPFGRLGTFAHNKIVPMLENYTQSNKEIFVHYNIPIFTFKTHKLPPGKYDFPFNFTINQHMCPSFNYNNKGFQFNISYAIAAELEEDGEGIVNEDGDVIMNNLRGKKELKLIKSQGKPNDATHTTAVGAEHIELLKLPTFLCLKLKTVELILRLEKTFFHIGDSIRYELECALFSFDPKKCIIKAHLIEDEIISGQRHTSRFPLEKLDTQANDAFQSINNKGTKITGNLILKENMVVKYQTPNHELEHFLEIYFIYTSCCGKGVTIFRAPIVIKQAENAPETPDSVNSTDNEDTEDDVMIMPMSKFKLEEKYNLLSKTADVLNELEA